MDTLPLPPRPSLEQYQKRAKSLVTAALSPDPGAIRAWASAWLHALARHLDAPPTPFIEASIERATLEIERRVLARSGPSGGPSTPFALADAQHLLAAAHGFASWADFARHVEDVARHQRGLPNSDPFEAAADAVVTGDIAALERLLGEHPDLVRARSRRVHHATLLHYVSANGVEDFRQKTPPNAVAIAQAFLGAGAEVDALADTYGGGTAQTTMNLLVSSTHPAEAGLHPALVEVLLDAGAAINGLDNDGSPLMTALAFGYLAAAETLERRGARVDNVVAAAGLGREDLVRRFVLDRNTLSPDVQSFETRWLRTPREPKAHLEMALIWACKFGHAPVAEYLLALGVDLAAHDTDRMTGLHWAAANGMSGLIDALIRHGAPLEVRNQWGGTVLGSTTWFVMNRGPGWPPVPGADYPAVLELLLRAGADVREADYPTGHVAVDGLLERHGAQAPPGA